MQQLSAGEKEAVAGTQGSTQSRAQHLQGDASSCYAADQAPANDSSGAQRRPGPLGTLRHLLHGPLLLLAGHSR